MRLLTQFWVPGKPATAGSKTAYRTPQGRMIVTPASKFTRPWMAHVKAVAQGVFSGELELGPVELCIEFHLLRPGGHYKSDGIALSTQGRRKTHHISKPDTTKLLRAIEDALTGILWKDDTQVVSQQTRKCYVHQWEQPGALVAIYAIGPEDAERLQPSSDPAERTVCGCAAGDSGCREAAGEPEAESVPTLF